MRILETVFLAIGLSMDAFAVAICKGLSMGKATVKKMCIVGLWFGLFQALMPALGYTLGKAFSDFVAAFDHYVAFALLFIIGANMIRESFSKEENCTDCSLAFGVMLMMALATSIDALAAGVGFAFMELNVSFTVIFIGVTTFLFSFAGVKIGSVFGTKYKKRAEICGGVILILLGTKMLIEGLLG